MFGDDCWLADFSDRDLGRLIHMTFAVERINGVRLALDDRAVKLPAGDPLAERLQAAAAA